MTVVQTPQSRCGFALRTGDITPPVGMYHRMWGAAKQDISTGVHRPLRATSAVFQSVTGSEPVVLVSLEHCILGQEEHRRLLHAITDTTEIATDSIVITCTHTHAAGILDLTRTALPGGDRIPMYFDQLCQTVAGLVSESLSALAPATIVYGQGRCDLAAHRDFYDETTEQHVCGFHPHHPADDTVLVARIENRAEETLATVVNYACHPTTLAWENTLISPDYPGAMTEVVEETTLAPCLFLQGASGELGPKEGFVGDTQVADRNGRQLGYAALSALTSLPRPNTEFRYRGPVVSGATLGAWEHQALSKQQQATHAEWRVKRTTIPLPYRTDQPTAAEWQTRLDSLETQEHEASQQGETERAAEFRALAERARRALKRQQALPSGDQFPYQALLWRIGDAIWLAVQGEPYSYLQTELRQRFPHYVLIVITISFTWDAAYLPTSATYGKDIYQQNIAVVEQGSLEVLVDRLTDEVRSLL